MERILSLEIILFLLRDEAHVREIAKNIGVNHMAVSRALRGMVKDNAVDYRTVGRSKVYSIKKSLEARNMVLMAEAYKQNKAFEKHPLLRRIASFLQKREEVSLAAIYGSYAKDIAKKDSDVDLFMESDDRKLRELVEGIDSRLSVKIGKYKKDNPLIAEIWRDHVILKGLEAFYERSGFFGNAS
ncbi:MAG: nucleotidyltransferase domain-containing protein [Candidatus Altiarchaeota archaeon]|nr:nucleotidyltransferase domain-containing protein [Candidatus Altiarchaeota archaeon]